MSDPVLEFPFSGGFDESTREEILEPSKSFTTLENGRQNHYGGYEKRPGYDELSVTRIDGTERETGRRIFPNGDQLCTIDSAYVDVYSETLGRSVQKSRVPEATVRLREIPTVGRSTAEDVAVANGYAVVSYFVSVLFDGISHNGRQGVVLIDAVTGAVIRGPEIIDTSTVLADVRLASYGNYIVAFTCDTNAGQIRAKYLDTTSATTINGGWQTLGSFPDFNTGFDCANCASDDRVAIAYGSTDASSLRIKVKTLTISGELETVNVATTNALDNASGVALSEGGATLWLAYFDAQDIMAIGFDPSNIDGTPLASAMIVTTLAAQQAPRAIYICARDEAGKAVVLAQVIQSVVYETGFYLRRQAIQTVTGAATFDGVIDEVIGGALIKSRPFLRGARVYAHFDSSGTTLEGALCDCTPPTGTADGTPYLRPVAVATQRGLSGGSNYARRRCAAIDSSRYVMPLNILQSGNQYGMRLAEYNFADPLRWRPVQLNGATYLGGGVLSIFAGDRAFEAGFLSAPAAPIVDATTGTGQTLASGRRYVATFEQIDGDGNWHVSGVSVPSGDVEAVVNKEVIVRVPPCTLTSRGVFSTTDLQGQSIRVGLWATLDENAGEEPYHRIASLVNTPSSVLLEFSDTIDDDYLATQALLYGTGNLPGTGASQDHRAPIGLTHICSYNGMLVGANGRTVTCSSQPIDGEGQWFSPVFDRAIDEDATGIAVQDGTVIVFTRRGAWSTAGASTA